MNEPKIIPIGDRVVLSLTEQPTEQKTASGIYIPAQSVELVYEGTVVAVGNPIPQWPEMICKVGDYVRYAGGCGTPITKDGKEYLILQEREILAII